MVGALDFEADGRVYACRREQMARGAAWWWFTVAGDGHRYAPFRADEQDTVASVRSRVVEYYSNHLARRAEPMGGRPAWGRRPNAAARPADAPAQVVPSDPQS